jgi:hypothetical protein
LMHLHFDLDALVAGLNHDLLRSWPHYTGLLYLHRASAPQSFDVSLRLRFGRHNSGESPHQADFEIQTWKAHDAGSPESRRLGQRGSFIPRKTKALDFTDHLAHEVTIRK